MSFLFSMLASRLGQVAAVALVAFVAGFVVCWKWCHRDRTFTETLSVSAVANGATLECQAGLFGRRIRRVVLAGIAAPGLNDPMGPESKANLERIAGATIRVASPTRPLAARTLVGQCWGETGVDLALAQVTAGLATCNTAASRELQTAQREAQRARRGLWSQSKDNGSRWWHFSCASDEPFPDPTPTEETGQPPESRMFPFDLSNLVQTAVLGIVVFWIAWAAIGQRIVAKWQTAAAVAKAVDTSQQLAAYGALTAIRHVSVVERDPKACECCEYLRSVVTAWPGTEAKTDSVP